MLRTSLCLLVGAALTTTVEAQNCFDLNIGTALSLTDDSTAMGLPLGFAFTFNGVAYTDICVCSNGYIWFGPTAVAGGDYTPTVAELTAGAPRICPLWGDFNPAAAGSGKVYFSNTVPGIAKVTWANVYEFGGTNAVSLQVTFDAANNITIAYGSNPAIGGTASTAILIGASQGGAAPANPVVFAPRPFLTVQNTFHETLVVPGAIPYSGFKMRWAPTVPGYNVTDVSCVPNSLPAAAQYAVVGAGCPAPNNVPASDDSTHALVLPFAFPHASGPYTDIVVSSNGFVTLGTTNPGSGCCSGSVATLLSGPARIAAFWQDLYVPGGGQIFAQLDAVSGDYLITWNNVPEFALTTPGNTFQIALSASGSIAIRYGTIQMINSAGRIALCGYSNGLAALDPGPTDLSAIVAPPSVNTIYQTFTNPASPVDLSGLSFLLLPNGSGGYIVVPGAGGAIVPQILVTPLTQAAAVGDLPNLGDNFTTNVSGVSPSPNGNIVLLLLSTEIPAFDLSVINMPGCNAYIALPEFMSFLNFTFGAPTTSFPIFVPLDMALAGQQIMTQAISDDLTANLFGWKASNGGRWTIGL